MPSLLSVLALALVLASCEGPAAAPPAALDAPAERPLELPAARPPAAGGIRQPNEDPRVVIIPSLEHERVSFGVDPGLALTIHNLGSEPLWVSADECPQPAVRLASLGFTAQYGSRGHRPIIAIPPRVLVPAGGSRTVRVEDPEYPSAPFPRLPGRSEVTVTYTTPAVATWTESVSWEVIDDGSERVANARAMRTGEGLDHVALELAVDGASARPGMPVAITVHARNDGSDAVWLMPQLELRWRCAAGTQCSIELYAPQYVYLGGGPRRAQPGEQISLGTVQVRPPATGMLELEVLDRRGPGQRSPPVRIEIR